MRSASWISPSSDAIWHKPLHGSRPVATIIASSLAGVPIFRRIPEFTCAVGVKIAVSRGDRSSRRKILSICMTSTMVTLCGHDVSTITNPLLCTVCLEHT